MASLSAVAGGQESTINDLIERLQAGPEYRGEYNNVELAWLVTLNAFAEDSRVVDLVCEDLSSEQFSYLTMYVGQDLRLLASRYPPESPHNNRVATSIEDRLNSDTRILNFRMVGLAAVDQGPNMKRALLTDLHDSPFPHWAASALAEYFNDDSDAHSALRAILMGDPVRASMIANVATKVLDGGEALPRLFSILRELSESSESDSARYDIVASALLQVIREQEIDQRQELEEIAEYSLRLMPADHGSARDDPRYEIARGLYSTSASRRTLAEIADVPDRPLAPYLCAFRDDPEHIGSLLEEAAKVLNSLPAFLRARVCQTLSERPIEPELTLRLTRRWADEVSGPNKSIASLAYHRSLLQARDDGNIDDVEWTTALSHLGEQASCYGPDHQARRRAAWVGFCVCGDWSTLEGRVETIGESRPVGVPLADLLYGPDTVFLQQLAEHWEQLRANFGETLLRRLSGIREEESRSDVWNALALVAPQNAVLQHELDSAVTSDPELLNLNGVLAWFVTRGRSSSETIADTLISHLQMGSDFGENIARVLLAEPERLGLDRGRLEGRLENAVGAGSTRFGDAALELLALLFPTNPVVHDAWQEYSEFMAGRRGYHTVPLRTYFAVAFAAAESSQIPKHLDACLERLEKLSAPSYDSILTIHLSDRLRRDSTAAATVRDAIISPKTSDSQAAVLAALLADATGLDEELLKEVEDRLVAQNNVALAPILRDRAVSASLSVQTALTRVADTAWDIRSP